MSTYSLRLFVCLRPLSILQGSRNRPGVLVLTTYIVYTTLTSENSNLPIQELDKCNVLDMLTDAHSKMDASVSSIFIISHGAFEKSRILRRTIVPVVLSTESEK